MSEYIGVHRNITEEDLFRALFTDIKKAHGEDTAYEMLEKLDTEAYEWAVKTLFEE